MFLAQFATPVDGWLDLMVDESNHFTRSCIEPDDALHKAERRLGRAEQVVPHPPTPRLPSAEAQVENPKRLNALMLEASECFFVAVNR
jgi:hypothetical protein